MRWMYVFAMAVLLNGCALSNLDSKSTLKDTTNKGVVVIGMDGGLKVMAFKADLVGDGSGGQADVAGGGEFSIAAVNGYVVTLLEKTQGDHRYAISRIADPNHLLPVTYYPCGAPVPVFGIEAGKINYIGNYKLSPQTAWLSQDVVYDETTAQTFIKSHYPGLADLPWVKQQIVFMHDTNKNCRPTLFLPLPVK
jgi:hypothetical protein